MREALQNDFIVLECYAFTISRIAKANNIVHKKINNKTVAKDQLKIEEERKHFVRMINYDMKNVIFTDEVSFCIDDHKRYAYGEKGKEKNIRWKHKQNKKRLTTIAAISYSGIVATKTIEGSVNKEVYKSFIEENLNHFKNKIIIQDNARCHHARIVKAFALENDIELKYNPAYSPEFNPIELAFNKVKCLYRQMEHENMLSDINRSFLHVTENDCKKFYNHSQKFIQRYQ